MDAADRIIAVSQRVRDQIIQRYHQAPEKIVVVYNAVDKEPVLDKASVRKALNEKFVLFLGRVTSQKGPEGPPRGRRPRAQDHQERALHHGRRRRPAPPHDRGGRAPAPAE